MRIDLEIFKHIPGESIYRPGDHIKGTITVWGPIQDDCLEVSIKLSGSADISPAGSYIYSTRLCKDEQLLAAIRPCNISRGRSRIVPFHIIMPKKTMPCCKLIPFQWPWTVHQHDLPPSMEAHRLDYSSCRIYYSLEATVTKDKSYQSPAKACEMLIVRGKKTTPLPFEFEFKRVTRILTRRTNDTSLYQEIFLGKEPTIKVQSITLVARVPSMVDLACDMPIWLSFKPESALAVSLDVPEVRLMSVKHTIKAKVEFRKPGGKEHVKTSEKVFKWSLDTGRLMHRDEDIDAASDMRIQLREILSTESFRSYTIAKRYLSETEIKVRIGKTEGVVKTAVFEVPELRVFSNRLLSKSMSG